MLNYLIFIIIISANATAQKLRMAMVTDTHIGESCHGDLSFDNCKPVRALEAVVERLNSLKGEDEAVDLVFVSGDITSSALPREFAKAHEILSRLNMPWLPAIGNHDAWTYERNADGTFDQTSTPIGDQMFAQVFGEQLKNGPKGAYGKVVVSEWPDGPCLNGDYGFKTYHHNYVVDFPAFPHLHVIVLDWAAREAALPEPGVGPQAELHNYEGGTLPFLDQQLAKYRAKSESDKDNFLIVQHHPFHNRDVLDPLGNNVFYNFTFDMQQLASVQETMRKHYAPRHFRGVQAGHMHRWYNGTAFTKYTALNQDWMSVPEIETPASKGWFADENFVSSFTLLDVDSSGSTSLQQYWKVPITVPIPDDGGGDGDGTMERHIWRLRSENDREMDMALFEQSTSFDSRQLTWHS